MEKTIKELFEDNKKFLNDGGCLLYEELDDEGLKCGSWCPCQSYSDFKEYTEKCLDEIIDKLKNIKVIVDKEYSFDFTYDDNKKDVFKFRFRKVEENIDPWDVAEADGFPAYN